MHHRDGIRPRPIDDHKPYYVIKDLAEAKLNSNKEGHAELCNIEKELYKVLAYYDKIRKIEIPKSKIINEKNDKNNKNENKVNYHINNNIIYTNDISNDKNNTSYILNYKLSEFKRPDNYIIYSSSDKNKVKSTKKVYEAKDADKIFLNIRDNFMKIEELENIIVDLENHTINEKDDKINEENARKLIEQKYPRYKKYEDSIINHFKDRRNTSKKSLIRKKWHLHKSADKYLNITFRKRERDKIKTRKNNHNKDESLNKILEEQTNVKTNILSIIESMEKREMSLRNILKIDELRFQTQCFQIKNIEIPPNLIKENNIIKDYIEKNMRLIIKKNDLNELRPLKEIKNNKIITNTKNTTNGTRSSKSSNGNIMTTSTNYSNEKIEEIIPVSKPSSCNKNNQNQNKNNSNIENISTFPGGKIKKKSIEKKTGYTKNIIKHKNVFPFLSLESLINVNNNCINLDEEDYLTNYKKNQNSNLRVRIRLNRNNKLTVDRYIQEKNDTNPFHDSYNDDIKKYKKYGDNIYDFAENNKFEIYFNSYNKKKVNYTNLLSDNDDDDPTELSNEIKNFSNSYKQFLKQKRMQSNN